MMIRMPRYYEGNQEEDKKEEEGEGVKHGRLFLVVIILIGTIFTIFIFIMTFFIIIIICIMIFITVIISANNISITSNKSITAGVLLLLCLMWCGEDLPANGLHFWPLWTSSFVASVILDDEGEDDDDVGHNDQCNADSAYFLPFWPL